MGSVIGEWAEASASPNIALVKYWGKAAARDGGDSLFDNMAANRSLSLTLESEQLRTITRVEYINGTNDELLLNGKSLKLTNRHKNVLQSIRELAKSCGADDVATMTNVRVTSTNNFPTAAGMASSASGAAALTTAIRRLLARRCSRLSGDAADGKIREEIVAAARRGSGSAVRSLLGGAVVDELNSVVNIPDASGMLAAMRVLIVVFTSVEKTISSTEAMERTSSTSQLWRHRVENVVDDRIDLMKKSITVGDWKTLMVETMRDSNQLHALCMDTMPPVLYLNENSFKLIHAVHEYNAKRNGEEWLGYTFDAGPNCHLLVRSEAQLESVMAMLAQRFSIDPRNNVDCDTMKRGCGDELAYDIQNVIRCKLSTTNLL